MHLFLLGVSHRTAPVDLREKLDFSSRDVGAAVEALAAAPSAAESVVLSTCNRSEIYVASTATRRRAKETRRVSERVTTGSRRDASCRICFRSRRREAAQHLFRVAAGLDSLVVGEPQILGQVKEAFQAAASGAAPARCSEAVRLVVQRRQARAHRDGPRRGRGIDQLRGGGASRERFSAGSRAAGCWSSAPAKSARSRRSTCDRGRRRDRDHEPDRGACARRWPCRSAAARCRGTRCRPRSATADIVDHGHGSPAADHHAGARRGRHGRRRSDPLYIIDMAVPRDVEASVGDIEQVFLYNIDDLQRIVQENISHRGAEVERAEAIVGRGAGEVRRVAAVPQRDADHRGAARAIRRDARVGAAAAGRQARRAVTGDAGAVRGSNPAHHREAAARSHRAAQGVCRTRKRRSSTPR